MGSGGPSQKEGKGKAIIAGRVKGRKGAGHHRKGEGKRKGIKVVRKGKQSREGKGRSITEGKVKGRKGVSE